MLQRLRGVLALWPILQGLHQHRQARRRRVLSTRSMLTPASVYTQVYIEELTSLERAEVLVSQPAAEYFSVLEITIKSRCQKVSIRPR